MSSPVTVDPALVQECESLALEDHIRTLIPDAQVVSTVRTGKLNEYLNQTTCLWQDPAKLEPDNPDLFALGAALGQTTLTDLDKARATAKRVGADSLEDLDFGDDSFVDTDDDSASLTVLVRRTRTTSDLYNRDRAPLHRRRAGSVGSPAGQALEIPQAVAIALDAIEIGLMSLTGRRN